MARRLRTLNREELIDVVGRLLRLEIPEAEEGRYFDLIDRSVAHPAPTDVMYKSTVRRTPEEIVDILLSVQATPLPPPGGWSQLEDKPSEPPAD